VADDRLNHEGDLARGPAVGCYEPQKSGKSGVSPSFLPGTVHHVKSGVSPSFLPEKTNRHRITRAVDIQDGSFSVSPVSRREAFVAAGRKSQDTIFENDTAGVKTEGVISRAVHCFKMPSLAKSPPTCDAFRRSASAMLVPPMVRSKPIVAFRKAAITSGPERLRIRLASSPIVTLRT
jgi:hypothetical protein